MHAGLIGLRISMTAISPQKKLRRVAMSNRNGISDTQRNAQLNALRRDDSDVVEVELSCSHAALYVLEQGASVHWRKLGIEGFFYVIRRYVS